jgi:hypothetical protein
MVVVTLLDGVEIRERYFAISFVIDDRCRLSGGVCVTPLVFLRADFSNGCCPFVDYGAHGREVLAVCDVLSVSYPVFAEPVFTTYLR